MTTKSSVLLCGLAIIGAAASCNKVTPLVTETYPSHAEKVCILVGPVPAEIEHTAIADIHVQLNSYGGDRKAKRGLANYARKIGAQAVMNSEFHNKMGAPVGDGRAVRYADPAATPPAECEWY